MLEFVDVLQARKRIAGIAEKTPLVHSGQLSKLTGCEVLLKLETIQPTGAFKIRGAANAIAQLFPSIVKKEWFAVRPAITVAPSLMLRASSAAVPPFAFQNSCRQTKSLQSSCSGHGFAAAVKARTMHSETWTL